VVSQINDRPIVRDRYLFWRICKLMLTYARMELKNFLLFITISYLTKNLYFMMMFTVIIEHFFILGKSEVIIEVYVTHKLNIYI
jgi:hypothetical protein